LDNFVRDSNFEDATALNVVNKDLESANLQIVLEYRAILNRITDFDIDRNRNSDIEIFEFIYERFFFADFYIFPDMENQRDEIPLAVRFIDFYEIDTQSI
jgi:hypothetical protein